MKLQRIKRVFFNWLKLQNAYDEYKQARHAINHVSDVKHPYYRKTLNDPFHFISEAFTWRSTPQGHRFWEELSVNWRKYLAKFKTDSRYN